MCHLPKVSARQRANPLDLIPPIDSFVTGHDFQSCRNRLAIDLSSRGGLQSDEGSMRFANTLFLSSDPESSGFNPTWLAPINIPKSNNLHRKV